MKFQVDSFYTLEDLAKTKIQHDKGGIVIFFVKCSLNNVLYQSLRVQNNSFYSLEIMAKQKFKLKTKKGQKHKKLAWQSYAPYT